MKWNLAHQISLLVGSQNPKPTVMNISSNPVVWVFKDLDRPMDLIILMNYLIPKLRFDPIFFTQAHLVRRKRRGESVANGKIKKNGSYLFGDCQRSDMEKQLSYEHNFPIFHGEKKTTQDIRKPLSNEIEIMVNSFPKIPLRHHN